MKSLDFDKRIDRLKRQKKIIDKQIELAELQREDQRERESHRHQPAKVETQHPQSA